MFAPIGAVKVTLVTMEEQQPSHPLSAAISYFLCRAVALPAPFLGRGAQRIGQDLTTSQSGR